MLLARRRDRSGLITITRFFHHQYGPIENHELVGLRYPLDPERIFRAVIDPHSAFDADHVVPTDHAESGYVSLHVGPKMSRHLHDVGREAGLGFGADVHSSDS